MDFDTSNIFNSTYVKCNDLYERQDVKEHHKQTTLMGIFPNITLHYKSTKTFDAFLVDLTIHSGGLNS